MLRNTLLLIIFMSLTFCSTSDKNRLKNEIKDLESQISVYSSEQISEIIQHRNIIILKFDTLINKYTQDDELNLWINSKKIYTSANEKDNLFLKIKNNVKDVEKIEVDTEISLSKDTDSLTIRKLYLELGNYLDILKEAENSLQEFLRKYPNSTYNDSLNNYKLEISSKRKALEYLCYTLIEIDIYMYAAIGRIWCAFLIETWTYAIDNGVDFSSYVDTVTKIIDANFDTEQTVFRITSSLIKYEPNKFSPKHSKDCYDILEESFLLAKKINNLSVNPTGSLFSYSAEARNCTNNIEDLFNKFMLYREKILR